MASVEECRAAVQSLVDSLMARSAGKTSGLDRTVSCTVTDLDLVFSGRLHDGRADDVTSDPRPKAQVRLSASSDDLVGLSNGSLEPKAAFFAGRLKVSASLGDMLKLKSML